MTQATIDLALDDHGTCRMQAWVTGALVFVALIAFAAAATSRSSLAYLMARPNVVTIALPPDMPGADSLEELVRELFPAREAIAWFDVVDETEVRALASDWLGREVVEDPGFAPPLLLEVAFRASHPLDVDRLETELRRVAPEAAVIAADGGASRTGEQLRAVFLLGTGTGLVFVLGCVAATLLLVRENMRTHGDTFVLLRLLGAEDGLIARQVEQWVLLASLSGGLVAFALATLVLGALLYGSPGATGTAWMVRGPGPLSWLLVATVPVVTALLASFAAKLRVRVTLKRFP